MLQLPQHASLEEASSDLRRFILDPVNWVPLESLARSPELRPGQTVLVRFGPGPKGLMAAEVRPDGGSLGPASH